MNGRRTGSAVVLAAALAVAAAGPASAQGSPVAGYGNHFYLAGAGNEFGRAADDFRFGDPADQVYFGDFVDENGVFGGDGVDDAVVRRGSTFIIRGQQGRSFQYGDAQDTVLVGDWDGDGTDTLAVRRGNEYLVKNDIDSGVADYSFRYGDPGDEVLVGNWDGDTSDPRAEELVTTDTLMVRRGNHYFVTNDTTTGVADYDFRYGDAGDTVLVGDWATAPLVDGDTVTTPPYAGDFADQLAVRRSNVYHLSEEVRAASESGTTGLVAIRRVTYGDVGDTAFAALLEQTYDVNGAQVTLRGDGLAVRRND